MEESKVNLDLNNDGVVDKKDASIAGKVLSASKKQKATPEKKVTIKEDKAFTSFITPRSDKEFLKEASEDVKTLEAALRDINDGVIRFDGQYKEARKQEAIDYLTRTIKERS